MSEQDEFGGFSIPTKNFFLMPNCWTDITAKIDNLAELKVVEYVLRHTWGYQEYGITKTISVDEFMHGRRRKDRTRIDNGTGLSEPSVKDGIKRAVKHGYLICEVDDKDQGRVKKSYGLKMSVDCIIERGKDLTPQESYPVTSLPPEGKDLTPRGKETYPRSEKDTIETNSKKEKSENVVTANADANATPAPSERTQETPAEQPEEKPKKRATRKPRAKKFEVPAEYQDRVNKVYEHLDTWRQKITGDPEEHFSHDAESDQAICSLFDGKPPTPKKLEQVCDALWNEPRNTRSGYWAREHMTIVFICKQYKAKSIVLATSEKKPQETTSYSVGGYTYNPEQVADVPALQFVGPSRHRNKRRGA